MKKAWLHIAFVLLGLVCYGQSFQSASYGVELKSLDYLDEVCPPVDDAGLGFSGMQEISQASAERIVNEMLTNMGITNRYKLRECEQLAKNNARAQAFNEDGRIQKYIVYDIKFLKEIANSAETNYAAMFVLAHEVGHHINDHSINYAGSEITPEIEADLFAGTRLSIIGVNLEETLRAVRTIKHIKTRKFDTHPGRMDRMKAVYEGWMNYAKNDDDILRDNAKYIKAYEKEIAYYEGLSGEKQNTAPPPKPTPIASKDPKRSINKEPTIKKRKTLPKTKKNTITKTRTNTITKEPTNRRVPKLLPRRGGSRGSVSKEVADMVLQNYFKALGGMKKVNGIKNLTYTERTRRSDRPSKEYNLDYTKENHNLLLVNERVVDRVTRQFKISNDSLYHKRNDFGSWNHGIPESETLDEEAFTSFIGSHAASFMEDFELLSSPELYKINKEVQFNGQSCYKMELREKLIAREYRPNVMGKTVTEEEFRYYGVADNLLVGIEKVRKTFYVRGGAPRGMDKKSSTLKILEYETIDGVQFPKKYEIKITTKLRKEIPESMTITKRVGNISFTQ